LPLLNPALGEAGELKAAGEHRQLNDFWVGGIEKIE